MQVEGGFSFNSIIVISTLSEEDAGSSRRLVEDLEVLSRQSPGFTLLRAVVHDIAQMRRLLLDIRNSCRKGMLPIVHIDGHGCRIRGLEIGRSAQYMSWDELIKSLRKINRATHNNLCAVISACEAAYIVRSISFFKPAPFYVLLAPQEKVSVGYLENRVLPFYRELLRSESVDQAFQTLDGKFKYFHAEKIFVISIAKYIKEHCVGKGKTVRRERLLTEALEGGIPNTPDNRRLLRRSLKSELRPSDVLIEKYGSKFLFDRSCSISMDMIFSELGIRQ